MVDFHPLINRKFPGILTQMSRDPNTKHYGSFDRNWWHYKIRDFSSVILQQGGYFLELVSEFQEYQEATHQLRAFARASVDFWAGRAIRRGAFEEYYPWEDGYPPLAFSTLAISKIILAQNLDPKQYTKALRNAANKLAQRFEQEAANQQIAGLAALAALKKIDPALVDVSVFNRLTGKTLSLQSAEGWFNEYDGPDLGYLSVSLDCLWDLFDFTGEQCFADSAGKAFGFLSQMVLHNQGPIGMHNSRNTDYVVPYGICRFLQSESAQIRQSAGNIIHLLFSGSDHPDHFFQAVDDRYWCHYIGHSVARAQMLLDRIGLPERADYTSGTTDSLFNDSGYALVTLGRHRIIASCLKGGILSIKKDLNYFNDFGWIVMDGTNQSVTHWWQPENRFSTDEGNIRISGHPVRVNDNLSNPLKHLILRVLSFLTGHRVISRLKNLLIFRKGDKRVVFNRQIEISEESIVIHDAFSGLKGNETIIRAPRFSKRHVASADSFHREDLSAVRGYAFDTENHWDNKRFISKTTVILD